MTSPSPSYVDLLEYDRTYKRQSWFVDYLRNDLHYRPRLDRLLSPIEIGLLEDSTRVVVVDFFRERNGTSRKELHSNPKSVQDIADWLKTSDSDIHVRLVCVSTTSGVSAQQRQWQLDRKGTAPKPDAPVLTTPRRPGGPDSHAIFDHVQRLPDPEVLCTVANAIHPHPDMLLRFLDHDKHLTHQLRTRQARRLGGDPWSSQNDCMHIQVGVDPANHMIAMVDHDLSDDTWTGRMPI